jgi:hypothetical protein
MSHHLMVARSVSEQLPTVAIRAAVEVICNDSHGPSITLTVIKTPGGFRRSRPGIPSIFRAPFQPDGARDGVVSLVGSGHVTMMRVGSIGSALLVQAFTAELCLMCVVDDPVEDGVGQRQVSAASKALLSASRLSIDCDSSAGGQVIADPRDNPVPRLPRPAPWAAHVTIRTNTPSS